MNTQEFIERASNVSIAVIGDYIQDRYIIGEMERISPEAPVPVLRFIEQRYSSGGAGNVTKNLENIGVHTQFFHSPNSRVVKTRIMAGNHHIVRIDEDIIAPPLEWRSTDWRESFENILPHMNCVVLSNYHKGTIDEEIASEVIHLCIDKKIPVIADAKRDFWHYRHANIVKCNAKEWTEYKNEDDTGESQFCDEFDIDNLVITRGEKGIYVTDREGSYGAHGVSVPIVDVCGAGDTVTAILAVCLALDIDLKEGIKLANAAAAEVCKHPGVYSITKEDILNLTF
jgi:D-beta-D-heptose 7-phosphate kinase/D-beta-D-heptose 1-phosphate adenosyltransferase